MGFGNEESLKVTKRVSKQENTKKSTHTTLKDGKTTEAPCVARTVDSCPCYPSGIDDLKNGGIGHYGTDMEYYTALAARKLKLENDVAYYRKVRGDVLTEDGKWVPGENALTEAQQFHLERAMTLRDMISSEGGLLDEANKSIRDNLITGGKSFTQHRNELREYNRGLKDGSIDPNSDELGQKIILQQENIVGTQMGSLTKMAQEKTPEGKKFKNLLEATRAEAQVRVTEAQENLENKFKAIDSGGKLSREGAEIGKSLSALKNAKVVLSDKRGTISGDQAQILANDPTLSKGARNIASKASEFTDSGYLNTSHLAREMNRKAMYESANNARIAEVAKAIVDNEDVIDNLRVGKYRPNTGGSKTASKAGARVDYEYDLEGLRKDLKDDRLFNNLYPKETKVDPIKLRQVLGADAEQYITTSTKVELTGFNKTGSDSDSATRNSRIDSILSEPSSVSTMIAQAKSDGTKIKAEDVIQAGVNDIIATREKSMVALDTSPQDMNSRVELLQKGISRNLMSMTDYKPALVPLGKDGGSALVYQDPHVSQSTARKLKETLTPEQWNAVTYSGRADNINEDAMVQAVSADILNKHRKKVVRFNISSKDPETVRSFVSTRVGNRNSREAREANARREQERLERRRESQRRYRERRRQEAGATTESAE